MKTVIINASPRKNWNTAQMLRSAMEGAKAAGSEVEYYDLYDLDFSGCRSCLACKRRTAEPNRCYWKDGLSPVLASICSADSLIIGSPLYYGDTTAKFHALFERLAYSTASFRDFSCTLPKKLKVGIVLTMNASKEYFEQNLQPKMMQFQMMQLFSESMEFCNSYDTLQVKDYSGYELGRWDPAVKQQRHDTVFQEDKQAAYDMGVRLGAGE